MKHPVVMFGCLLILTLTAFVSCQEKDITVTNTPAGIKLTCKDEGIVKGPGGEKKDLELEYNDNNSGEYLCLKDENTVSAKIHVKFRTCDNCVEMDTGSISGIIIGDVVATVVIGVAVYLIASQAGTAPVTSNKKSSDRQRLVQNEARANNDHYQPLNPRGGKDTYDQLTHRK